jgi:DNA-binding response OmpR family regulator
MGNESIKEKDFLLVDVEDYWREFSFVSLNSIGCKVRRYKSYKRLRVRLKKFHDKPDLIIIGCSKPAAEEVELIKLLRANNFRQLILCSFLSREEMKELFLAGADDVTDKPFDSVQLLTTIKESLDNIALREGI